MPLVALSLLLSSGLALESYALPEARVVAELPGMPEMVAAGPAADVPQSVQGFAWRAQGSGIQVTVAYDKWKSGQFASEIALDRLARHTYGKLDGFTIQPAEVSGLTGALLTLEAPQGATAAVWNVKSGTEAWQITVKATDGFLSEATLEDLRDGLRIDAKPEPAGVLSEWGNPVEPKISSRPEPSPLQWSKAALAGLTFDAPVTLDAFKADRNQAETTALAGLQEWHGAVGDVEVFLSTFTIKENLGIDLAAWGDSFRLMMDRDGLRGWEPKTDVFALGDAVTRDLSSAVTRNGQACHVEILLASKGRQAWALQVRVRDTAEGRDAVAKIKATLALKP
jgi:hypothetical protein